MFPILEQLLKTMVLNIRRLQQRNETVIYGLSLGLGFGSIFTPVSLIIANFQLIEPVLFLSVVVGSFGIILFHGATGIILGYGIYQRELARYLIYAILIHLPLTLVIFITTFYQVQYLQISLVLYGLILYWYATKRIMPRILMEGMKRKRRKIKLTM